MSDCTGSWSTEHGTWVWWCHCCGHDSTIAYPTRADADDAANWHTEEHPTFTGSTRMEANDR